MCFETFEFTLRMKENEIKNEIEIVGNHLFWYNRQFYAMKFNDMT